MTDIKSVIAELREHHRGITFYRRMSYGKDNGHGWQKIDLKHYLPQLLEYVEELEDAIEQTKVNKIRELRGNCGQDR